MPIRFEVSSGIAVITIDNGPLNILTPQLHRELFLALQRLESDQSLLAGVLTGEGSRAFCAGDDIKGQRVALTDEEQVRRDLFPRTIDEPDPRQASWERDIMAMVRRKPIVAAIRGWCIGQGFIYACHLADIRVASDQAQFGLPEIAYGMSGAAAIAGVMRHLPRSLAMQMALTGDPISAAEAHRVFLVNELTPDAQAFPRAMEIAARIARHPPLALRTEMESLQRSEFLDPASTYSMARALDRMQRIAAPVDMSVTRLAYSRSDSDTESPK